MWNYLLSFATSASREWQAIFLLVIFVFIIIGAYYVTHLVARVQKGSLTNRNLEIIEAISVGQNKSVQLVRTGNKYMVIGVTRNEINILQTLDEDDITLEKQDTKSNLSFKNILNRYQKGENGDDHHETKDQ